MKAKKATCSCNAVSSGRCSMVKSAEIAALTASGRRWHCKRIEGRWQGVLYAPDRVTESLVTAPRDSVAEAVLELASKWTWMVEAGSEANKEG
jgi:hypothetical protein